MTTARIIPAQIDQRTVSLATADYPAAPLTVEQVLTHVVLIQKIMSATMKEGEHYARIPGCGDKPALLKPGAEKLCLLFRLAPTYEVEERHLNRGHREYRVTVTLTSITTRVLIGQGVGSCSTLETEHRFRTGSAEITAHAVPRVYREIRQDDPAKAQELVGGKGFSVKEVDGRGWMIARGGEKVETDNPADHYNTVLKTAKKRALVDAVLTTTAASDIFTQDLDDIANYCAVTVAARVASRELSAPSPKPMRYSAPVRVEDEPLDFRVTEVHFGKNRGLTLADLSPQQIYWYEKEWLPKKEGQSKFTGEDLALIRGLRAYRMWREAEKAQTPVRQNSDERVLLAGSTDGLLR